MIYIVLPVYNEEKNIVKVVGDIRKVLKGRLFKIVAVNDGSKDDSLVNLKKLAGRDLVIESYKVNMNVGAVFGAGINRVMDEAKARDAMVIMEADGTSDVTLLIELIREIEEKKRDAAIASRYVPGGGYRNFPLKRRIFSWGANFLMKKMFPVDNVSDYTIFYRAYRVGVIKEAVESFGKFGLIQSQGFVANAELLVKLSFFTDKISEIPFIYDYGKKKGDSKLGIVRTFTEYFMVTAYLKNVKRKMLRN